MKGLSKSKYIAFCQCPRMMWLNVYHPELSSADPSQQSRFEKGKEVGDLAMTIFGNFIDVTTKRPDGTLDLKAMIELTREEMEAGRDVICEASFSFDGNYCAVDILRRQDDGWSIYEVKSSTYKDEASDTEDSLLAYSRDIAYQKWVLEKCGINVKGTYLVRLDSSYVRHGELDVEQLFHIKDMAPFVANEFPKVEANIIAARQILSEPTEPQAIIGSHCRSPYECGFFSHCVGELPKPNVFDLYRMDFEEKCRLFHSGKRSFEDLEDVKLSGVRQLQVSSYLNGADFVDHKGIASFLKQLSYPLYFLDFETMQPAVPLYEGTRPYQQLAFQYSLHWLEEPDGTLNHTDSSAIPSPTPDAALPKSSATTYLATLVWWHITKVSNVHV
ncbi:MAG: DUF2779 domain-containing protein [Muribaculaceae bacterium]|nr:DUF2779 domain-containing protein [Muribaculaceae bacterium]